MIVPKKPGCGDKASAGTMSSAGGDLGDRRNPIPLVNLAKVDLAPSPVGDSSCGDDRGCGIFKPLAHDDIPAADSLDDPSCIDSFVVVSEAEADCPSVT